MKTILLVLALLLIASPVIAEELTFAWDAPINNEDGSVCTDLAGFIFYVNGKKVADTGMVQTYTISNLQTCTVYCGQASAYDTAGNESKLSSSVCKAVIGSPMNMR